MFIKLVYEEDIVRVINLFDRCDDTYDIPVKMIKLSKFIIVPNYII